MPGEKINPNGHARIPMRIRLMNPAVLHRGKPITPHRRFSPHGVLQRSL